MTASAEQQQPTAIPMSAGILALIEHVLLTRGLEINRTMVAAYSGYRPEACDWDTACRRALFTECGELARIEGVDLNEQTYRTIIAMNADDEVLQDVRNTPAPNLSTRFAFDPWLGQGRGGIQRLSQENEDDAKPEIIPTPTGAGATIVPGAGAPSAGADGGLGYRGELRDWLVADSLCEAKGDAQATARLEADADGIPYEVEVKRNGEQIYALMSRFGVEVASLILEVNKGVPALHIGDGFENNLHVHFAHGGAVITPDIPGTGWGPAPVDRYSYEGTESCLMPLQHETLEEHRQAVFDMLFEGYDFQGDVAATGATVAQDSGANQPALWEMRARVEDDSIPRRLVFKVRFIPGTAIPCDVIALDLDTGAEVGSHT